MPSSPTNTVEEKSSSLLSIGPPEDERGRETGLGTGIGGLGGRPDMGRQVSLESMNSEDVEVVGSSDSLGLADFPVGTATVVASPSRGDHSEQRMGIALTRSASVSPNTAQRIQGSPSRSSPGVDPNLGLVTALREANGSEVGLGAAVSSMNVEELKLLDEAKTLEGKGYFMVPLRVSNAICVKRCCF